MLFARSPVIYRADMLVNHYIALAISFFINYCLNDAFIYASPCRLLATLIIQPASPFGADVVCQNRPEFPMTDTQVALCKKYPGLISYLFKEAADEFKEQLYHHFKHERWNGRWNGEEINPPIFGSTEKFLQLRELLNYSV